MHSSNSTIAANFEQDIPELIENQLSVSLDRVQGYPHYVKFIVTSDYPITSPITITYQVQGEFYVDKQDEWGGAQPPTESFQSRDWTRTLNVGQSVWEFKEQPDVYDWAIVYFTLFVQIAFIDANIKKRKRTKKKIESFSFYSVRFCSIYIDLSVNKRMMCLFESNVLISATNLR